MNKVRFALLMAMTALTAFIGLEGQSSSSGAAAAGSGGGGGGGGGGGTTTTANWLYTYNRVADNSLDVPDGDSVAFDDDTFINGTALSHPSDEVIRISEPGTYKVTFVASTFNGGSVDGLIDTQYTAGVQVFIDGSGVGHQMEINVRGASLVLDEIINITSVPADLEIRVTEDILSLNEEQSASLTIIKLSAP